MIVLKSRKKSSRLRRRLLTLGVLLIPVGIYCGWQIGREQLLPRYRSWKQHKALGRAKEFLDKKDPAAAKLEIDIAFASMPGNPDTIRVAAELLEQVGLPQAVMLRRRVVEELPASVPDRLAFVGAALRFHDINAAREGLAGFAPAQFDQPAIMRANLAYAMATNNRAIADALFDKLATIEPQTDDMKVEHAMLLRQHPDRQKSEAARKELERFAENPKYALMINRGFMAEAIATRDIPAAKRYAALITSNPGAAFSDRLNEASLLLILDKQPFEPIFAQLAPLAAGNGRNAAEFSQWLLVQGKSAEADHWIDGLAPEVTKSPEVANVRMEIAAREKDWDTFGRLLEEGAWGAIPREVARLAMSAHLIGGHSLRTQVWDEAVSNAGRNVPALRVLLRVSGTWQWDEEMEHTLWAVLRADPSQSWAHASLMNVYRQRGDGKKMLEVITLLKEATPGSLTYRHDWALLSMLVLPTNAWDVPKQTAEEVYKADSANANYATTYAFALTLSGKTEEARTIIEKLTTADRENPLRSPYCAFVYGSCRRKAEFEKYAAVAGNTHILAEEKLLVSQGGEALERTPYVPVKSPATPKILQKSS